jgi:hypothetical protein
MSSYDDDASDNGVDNPLKYKTTNAGEPKMMQATMM